MNTFGQVVHHLRKLAGLRLEDVARAIKSHKGYVSGIESGKVNPPSVKFVLRLAKLFKPRMVNLRIHAYEEHFVELAWVSKAPALVREMMMGKLVDNPLARMELRQIGLSLVEARG